VKYEFIEVNRVPGLRQKIPFTKALLEEKQALVLRMMSVAVGPVPEGTEVAVSCEFAPLIYRNASIIRSHALVNGDVLNLDGHMDRHFIWMVFEDEPHRGTLEWKNVGIEKVSGGIDRIPGIYSPNYDFSLFGPGKSLFFELPEKEQLFTECWIGNGPRRRLYQMTEMLQTPPKPRAYAPDYPDMF
jgi:hypothetical protein